MMKRPSCSTILVIVIVVIVIVALMGIYKELGWLGIIFLFFVVLALSLTIANEKQFQLIFGIAIAAIIFLFGLAFFKGTSKHQAENCQEYISSTSLAYGEKINVRKPSIIIFDLQFAYLQKGQIYWSGREGTLLSWPIGCELFILNTFPTLEAEGFNQKDDSFFLTKGKLLISRPAITPTSVE